MTAALDPAIWRARDDSHERGDTRRLAHVATAIETGIQEDDPVLIGFACDAGVARNQGRLGAAQAPQSIRRMLAGLPAHDYKRLVDAGDVVCDGDQLEAAQDQLAARIAQVLSAGARPLVLGGGHEVAWGSFQGLRRWLDSIGDTQPVLVLNLDAHFDLRTGRPGSSGTPFDQIAEYCEAHGHAWQYACYGVSRLGNTAALYSRAAEIGALWIEDHAMQERHIAQRLADLDALLARAGHVYLTIDIDVLPAAVAPGVSAPAAYGVPLTVIEEIALKVKQSGKLRLADLAECNPDYDIDHRTSKVAARLAWQLLAPSKTQAEPKFR
ncbi:formimidoylglutamase [Bordetella genomosp. 4]|uniref:Formimidoylglutamase n=1 Tax=Bordetella genomosp. 4 TaxID=463044 RepID=A0A261U417_9BORD|nr:formimidoylglutamase [Bordetella genomosp. 4]OZI49702.1 formimidoylglutamase [Bordetella genomosp. 4]OZI56142.1 formimidoylglutamase [Bordetella genomosp. 4]